MPPRRRNAAIMNRVESLQERLKRAKMTLRRRNLEIKNPTRHLITVGGGATVAAVEQYLPDYSIANIDLPTMIGTAGLLYATFGKGNAKIKDNVASYSAGMLAVSAYKFTSQSLG